MTIHSQEYVQQFAKRTLSYRRFYLEEKALSLHRRQLPEGELLSRHLAELDGGVQSDAGAVVGQVHAEHVVALVSSDVLHGDKQLLIHVEASCVCSYECMAPFRNCSED